MPTAVLHSHVEILRTEYIGIYLEPVTTARAVKYLSMRRYMNFSWLCHAWYVLDCFGLKGSVHPAHRLI